MTKQEAIEILKGDFSKIALGENESHSELFAKAFDMAVESLNGQDANVPSNWIPCSERLPDEYGNYLVTSDEDVDIGTFNPNTAKWSGCDAEGFYWVYDIIAWMPLPDPYKESED